MASISTKWNAYSYFWNTVQGSCFTFSSPLARKYTFSQYFYLTDRVILLVLAQRMGFNQEFVQCPGNTTYLLLQVIRDNSATHKSEILLLNEGIKYLFRKAYDYRNHYKQRLKCTLGRNSFL